MFGVTFIWTIQIIKGFFLILNDINKKKGINRNIYYNNNNDNKHTKYVHLVYPSSW